MKKSVEKDEVMDSEILRRKQETKELMEGLKPIPVLYLDIDGTVRKSIKEIGKYVNKKEDVEVFEEVPDILMRYKAEGWKIVGISNQGGISLGYSTLEDTQLAMEETKRQCKGLFDFIKFCPHHPEADYIGAECICRKPKYGLIVTAINQLVERNPGCYFPLKLGLFVGDQPCDWQCASNTGIPFQWDDDWRQDPGRINGWKGSHIWWIGKSDGSTQNR